MSSDFDHIGLSITSEQEFLRLVTQSARKWPATPTPVGGSYVRAGGEDGAEFWVQLGPAGQPLGGHPHFSGTSRFNVRVTETLDASKLNGTPLDGSIMCTLVDDQEGVPILVECPDFRMHAAWIAPETPAVIQLCAIPRGIQISASPEEFAKTPFGKLASSGALIPSGLFSPQGEPTIPPRNEAILAGRVESCRELRNAIDGGAYIALSVRTLGGVVDVPVATRAMSPAVSPGAIIAGTFSLSGRIIQPLPAAPAHIVASAQQEIATMASKAAPPAKVAKPSLLGRLFGR